jgi:hypothetical protein
LSIPALAPYDSRSSEKTVLPHLLDMIRTQGWLLCLKRRSRSQTHSPRSNTGFWRRSVYNMNADKPIRIVASVSRLIQRLEQSPSSQNQTLSSTVPAHASYLKVMNHSRLRSWPCVCGCLYKGTEVSRRTCQASSIPNDVLKRCSVSVRVKMPPQ